jgi:hypothetical protein
MSRRRCVLLFVMSGCFDTTPVRHMHPPMASSSCGRLLISVDAQPGALVNTSAWLHHTLVNGAYDETLTAYFSFATGPQHPSSGMQVDIGDAAPAGYFLRLWDERDQVASMPAAVLPGSTLEKGGIVHLCLGPTRFVVPAPLGDPQKGDAIVEISGQIDTVIDDVSIHVPGSK